MERSRSLRRHRRYRKPWLKKCREFIRQFIAFLFSNVGIIGLVVGYTIAGSFIFMAIEGKHVPEMKREIRNNRSLYAETLWNITMQLNSKVTDKELHLKTISEILLKYQNIIVNYTRKGYDGDDDDKSSPWSFAGAFLYSLTVITTIVKCILDFVLSHAQGDERPVVTVSIFGKELLGLLDSGASHTILGNKGWKLLKDIGLSTLDRTGVTVANGDKWVDFWVRMGIVPDLRSKEWKFTRVNGTFADINAVEALHSRELLTSDQVEILDELVNDCFVRMGNSLGCTKIVEHKIELLDNGEPIKQRFYPVSPALMKHIDGELQDMLKKDVIEPSSSPWSSPIVMHIKILSMVFERLISTGLTLSQEKCKFCRRELQFLGYVVDENGLHVDPGKVEVILQIPTTSKISEVRSLIGTASWYRRFIPNFSTVIQPLTELLKKNTKFVWTPRQEAALREVKEHLISAPVMACPNFDLPFIVQTDASGYGIGAVLTQNHPDVGERVVSYLSRSLTKQERKFSTTERECLAVIWSIEKLRPYIEETHFTVVTDHWSLCWLNNLKDPTGRLGRWSLKLQQYSFDLVHRKGKENVVPDMLSRTIPIIDALDIAVNVDL
ncbi:hypothetical protein JTB14_036886 [Gonioctena quinquepunctata]|nr:hypothetical protein JTB14_036886 [Gonioctena quinquepunctata]